MRYRRIASQALTSSLRCIAWHIVAPTNSAWPNLRKLSYRTRTYWRRLAVAEAKTILRIERTRVGETPYAVNHDLTQPTRFYIISTPSVFLDM